MPFEKYAAAEANGIASETADGPNPLSFNCLAMPKPHCPSDDIEKEEKSLLKKALGGFI